MRTMRTEWLPEGAGALGDLRLELSPYPTYPSHACMHMSGDA